MTQVRVIVVTTEKPVASIAGGMEGRLGDAQHRGAAVSFARRVQARIAEAGDHHRIVLPAFSITCSATPAAPKASSKWPSIDAGPKLGLTAITSVPGAATTRAAAPMPWPSSRPRCWG